MVCEVQKTFFQNFQTYKQSGCCSSTDFQISWNNVPVTQANQEYAEKGTWENVVQSSQVDTVQREDYGEAGLVMHK